nr:recombinase family protein [Cereibacter sphaeroides]
MARNVAFIANLLESGAEVTAADMPEANRFVLHIMAAVAEQEGQAISERTRAALAAAKARGIALGWSIPSRKEEQRLASTEGARRNALKADQDARTLLPLIRQIGGQEVSLRQIAAEWNARGVRTARGGRVACLHCRQHSEAPSQRCLGCRLHEPNLTPRRCGSNSRRCATELLEIAPSSAANASPTVPSAKASG